MADADADAARKERMADYRVGGRHLVHLGPDVLSRDTMQKERALTPLGEEPAPRESVASPVSQKSPRSSLTSRDRCARVKPINLLQLIEVIHVTSGAFGKIRDKAVNGEAKDPGERDGYLVNGGPPIFGATDIKSFWACEDTCVPVGTCVRVAYDDPAWDAQNQALVERVDLGRRLYVLRGADAERKVDVAFGAVRV